MRLPTFIMKTVACALLVCGSVAVAGPLATDPSAFASGTANFSATGDSGSLLVDLDFAVFEPGVYPDDGVLGNDPSNGSEWVYAYQGFNVGGAGDKVFSTVTIGLIENSLAGNDGDDPLHVMLGGIGPIVTFIGVDSVVYNFSPQVTPGEFSTVLLFTSPNEPSLDGSASVINGGLSDTQSGIPTPVPEPAMLVLMGLAGLAVVRRRRA